MHEEEFIVLRLKQLRKVEVVRKSSGISYTQAPGKAKECRTIVGTGFVQRKLG